MPSWSPFSATSRSCGDVISPLMRCDLSSAMGEKLLFSSKKAAVPLRARLVAEALDEGIEGHRPQVLTAARAHSHASSLLFLFADHQLVGQLLQAMFPNFIGNFLVSQIAFDPETGLPQAYGDRFG